MILINLNGTLAPPVYSTTLLALLFLRYSLMMPKFAKETAAAVKTVVANRERVALLPYGAAEEEDS